MHWHSWTTSEWSNMNHSPLFDWHLSRAFIFSLNNVPRFLLHENIFWSWFVSGERIDLQTEKWILISAICFYKQPSEWALDTELSNIQWKLATVGRTIEHTWFRGTTSKVTDFRGSMKRFLRLFGISLNRFFSSLSTQTLKAEWLR